LIPAPEVDEEHVFIAAPALHHPSGAQFVQTTILLMC
jgi:hypothetical protein